MTGNVVSRGSSSVATALAALLVIAAGCGSGSDSSSSTDAPVVEAPTTATPGQTDPAIEPTDTGVDTSLGEDTGLAPIDPTATTEPVVDMAPEVTTTTIAPIEPIETSMIFPTGPYELGDDDLFILRTDGDLELHEQILDGRADSVERLVDNPDPRDAVDEGPGPNVVDDIAGVVNGAVVYSECCEPVAGVVLAAGDDGDSIDVGFGYDPALSPDGTRVATANDQFLSVTGVGGNGVGVPLNQDADARYSSVFDLEWVDDETVAMIRSQDSQYAITTHDATTLVETASVMIDGADANLGVSASFAGSSDAGEVVVAIQDPVETTLRFFDPDTLTESDTEPVVLPVDVSAVQIGAAGVLWVDDSVLFLLAPGEFIAEPLADEVLAAWFVRTATPAA